MINLEEQQGEIAEMDNDDLIQLFHELNMLIEIVDDELYNRGISITENGIERETEH